jgi:hypothetical protein
MNTFRFAAAILSSVCASVSMAKADVQIASTYLNFAAIAPGTAVAGFGAVNPLVDIEDPGSQPVAMISGSPGGASNLYGANACAPYTTQTYPCFGQGSAIYNGYIGQYGGLGDLKSEGASYGPNAPYFGPNDFTFRLAPGYVADSFTIRMLDEGDNNPWWATEGSVTVSGYTAGGVFVTSQTVSYRIDTASPRVNTDFSAGSFSTGGSNWTPVNPQNDADASAPSGDLGNFVFNLAGSAMNFFTVTWTNNGNGTNLSGVAVPMNQNAPLDPKVGFADVGFNVPEPSSLAVLALAAAMLPGLRRRRNGSAKQSP